MYSIFRLIIFVYLVHSIFLCGWFYLNSIILSYLFFFPSNILFYFFLVFLFIFSPFNFLSFLSFKVGESYSDKFPSILKFPFWSYLESNPLISSTLLWFNKSIELSVGSIKSLSLADRSHTSYLKGYSFILILVSGMTLKSRSTILWW